MTQVSCRSSPPALSLAMMSLSCWPLNGGLMHMTQVSCQSLPPVLSLAMMSLSCWPLNGGLMYMRMYAHTPAHTHTKNECV